MPMPCPKCRRRRERSEEHTSELQSLRQLVCRLLLEKKNETLWFALTGKTPFSGRTVEDIRRAHKSNVRPIEQLKTAHVPSRLRSLLESMLAFEPASRPGTQELAARLQRCSPEARSVRRTRVTLAAAAVLILGMSALFIFQPSFFLNAALTTVIYTLSLHDALPI